MSFLLSAYVRVDEKFIIVKKKKRIIKRTVTALEGSRWRKVQEKKKKKKTRGEKKCTCATAHSIRFIRHFSCFFFSSSPALRLLLQQKEEEGKKKNVEERNVVSIRPPVNSNIFLFLSFSRYPFFKHFCIIRWSIRIQHSTDLSLISSTDFSGLYKSKIMGVFWKVILTILILQTISKLKSFLDKTSRRSFH